MKNKLYIILILIYIISCENINNTESMILPLNSTLILENEDALDSFMFQQSKICNITTEQFSSSFSSSDTLYPKISFIYIKPDSNYIYKTNSNQVIDTLESYFNQALIKPKLQEEVFLVEKDILVNYSNYESFVNYYKEIGEIKYNSFYVVVFPEGVKFRQEISNGRRTSKIYGSALTIISEAGFIREESLLGPILAHELAHYWGLRHIFEKDGEDIDFGLSCTTGDLISDTPYVTGDSKYIYKEGNCYMYTLDTIYPDKFKDIVVHNITSYSDTRCMDEFTPNQIKTMRNNLLSYKQLYDKLEIEIANVNYKAYLYKD